MSSIRLFLLGTLAAHGPMHGYQIRHQAQLDRTELWTDVRVGSLYGALKRLEAEGLVREARSEREGKRPERTVYEITAPGRVALDVAHQEALTAVFVEPDPFDLALSYAARLNAGALEDVVQVRLSELETKRKSLEQLRRHAAEYLNRAEQHILRHREARLAAEVEWHLQLLGDLPQVERDVSVDQDQLGCPAKDDARENLEVTGETLPR